MFKNKKVLAINALIIAALLFGCTFLVVKDLLDSMNASNIVFWRYLVASILFFLAGGIPDKETIKEQNKIN